jgi:hypothetical protein
MIYYYSDFQSKNNNMYVDIIFKNLMGKSNEETFSFKLIFLHIILSEKSEKCIDILRKLIKKPIER